MVIRVVCDAISTIGSTKVTARCARVQAIIVLSLAVRVQAEMAAQASRIRMEQVLAEREAEKKQKLIENEIFLATEKALTEAEAHRYPPALHAKIGFALLTGSTAQASREWMHLKCCVHDQPVNECNSDAVYMKGTDCDPVWQDGPAGGQQQRAADSGVPAARLHSCCDEQHEAVLWRQDTTDHDRAMVRLLTFKLFIWHPTHIHIKQFVQRRPPSPRGCLYCIFSRQSKSIRLSIIKLHSMSSKMAQDSLLGAWSTICPQDALLNAMQGIVTTARQAETEWVEHADLAIGSAAVRAAQTSPRN